MDLNDIFKRRTRSPLRPRSGDIIQHIFSNFRRHPPHRGSLVLGEVDQWDKHIYIIGQQKPKPEDFRTTKDLEKLNYGMLTATEHSHTLHFIKEAQAQKLNNAILVTFIDTYGADISMESARDFQAFFISHLIRAFLRLTMPIISIILGEGGSRGALAIQVTDRRAQLDDALYATAPPESMAAIIFRDATKIKEALEILKPSAPELRKLGVIDHIIASPKDVSDVAGFSRNISTYLERTIKELSKVKIERLVRERRTRARSYGLPSGKTFNLMKFLLPTPLKKRREEPTPDLKIFTYEDVFIQVKPDYGNGLHLEPNQEYIKCGETSTKSAQTEGCGSVIPFKEYQDNFNVCPHCGRSTVMGALGWINCLTDEGSFHELYRDLTADELLEDSLLTPDYKKFVDRQVKRTHFKEALVTGEATVFGYEVVLTICEFRFSAGSMGVVFGEKFTRAVDYAIEKRYPLVSLCCSGGARLTEGILALMQMVKTVNAVNLLKESGLPYLSLLGDPATGGAIASFAALGDVIIAEPGALISFSGPRILESRGFPVDEQALRAESLQKISSSVFESLDYFHDIRGIHEVVPRGEMKRVICKYLEFYKKSWRH
ncbi:MAG: acetyl-CoA carboxylase carboxyl transferase subunit alpha/beta [Deltaproteobacteria bacterium]|nr:acetyl-CoA carboxylase carboxyl transferase subunit alpha/beta [Deltaproteobacteria bacterium]